MTVPRDDPASSPAGSAGPSRRPDADRPDADESDAGESEDPGEAESGEPETQPRGVDARLLVPALVAWTGTALGLSRPPATVLAAAGGLTLLCLLLIHRRWRRLRWSGLLAVTVSGTALCLLSLGAQTAVREAGLVPRLAQERATVTLEAVVTTDPRVVA